MKKNLVLPLLLLTCSIHAKGPWSGIGYKSATNYYEIDGSKSELSLEGLTVNVYMVEPDNNFGLVIGANYLLGDSYQGFSDISEFSLSLGCLYKINITTTQRLLPAKV